MECSTKGVAYDLEDIMYRLERWYTGVGGDSIRIDLLRFVVAEVDLDEALSEEKDMEDAIDVRGA